MNEREIIEKIAKQPADLHRDLARVVWFDRTGRQSKGLSTDGSALLRLADIYGRKEYDYTADQFARALIQIGYSEEVAKYKGMMATQQLVSYRNPPVRRRVNSYERRAGK